MTNITYIMSPYSNNPEYNYNRNLELTTELMKLGGVYYNPILYGHQFRDVTGSDFESWYLHNLRYMKICTRALLIKLPGWELSKGVAFEMEWFKKNNIEIYTMEAE